MSTITVRFVHRESHTPVLELEGVEASATVGTLRELLMERLASEEVCMMRVFVKWHAQIVLPGGKKRLIELTEEDSEASLSSMGISHLVEMHLDGPLTGDSTEGVGQALAVLGAQMHREQSRTNALLENLNNGQSRIAALLETLIAQNAGQVLVNQLTLLPSEAQLARQALDAQEKLAYGQLMLMERAEEGYQRLLNEAAAGLSMETHDLPIPFTLDRTTPNTTFTISDDGTTATKTSDRCATFRTSQPLTAANHKFAVKIVEDGGQSYNIIIGLLPKLSDAQVVQMEGNNGYIGSRLGGWGMYGDGYKEGDWQCSTPCTFAKGDVVVCDFNFAAKTLTLSCGDKKAVDTIHPIKEGDELYPAVTMWDKGQQVAFIAE